MAAIQAHLRGLFCMLCHVTVTGDAREDATLKTARTARVTGAMRIIVGVM